MFQPPSYEIKEEMNKVYKLKKAIYDLKQSPRVLFDKFSIVDARYELRWSSSDHFIFARYCSVSTIILTVYVDIVFTVDDHQDIIQLNSYFNSHFHIKNLIS